MLKNPSSRSYRIHQLGLSATLGTSGRSASRQSSNVSLLPLVHLVGEDDLIGLPHRLGAGRFGTCYVQHLAHFKVCVKIFKHGDTQSVCNEANILSNFKSKYFPYLFGVLMGASKLAIITSFHGFGDVSVTLHYALSTKSNEVLADCVIDWKVVIQQIVDGIDCLHVKYRVLHNDLKSDNIVIAPASVGAPFQVVIVDFGKACVINRGALYHLSMRDREQYKIDHPQIAPDLRDGLCKQNEASDVYSVGRMISRINTVKQIQGWPFIKDLIKQSMMYKSDLRLSLSDIKQKVNV